MTAPLPDGAQATREMRLALDDAHMSASELGYANAHGSSTPLNDPTETGAMKQLLGDAVYRVPVSGTKAYCGHALGAIRGDRGGDLRARLGANLGASDRKSGVFGSGVRPGLCEGNGRVDLRGGSTLEFVRVRWCQRVAGFRQARAVKHGVIPTGIHERIALARAEFPFRCSTLSVAP
jgi:hypothetical protein